MINILVVLYKKTDTESIAISSLISNRFYLDGKVNIILWNNTPEVPIENREQFHRIFSGNNEYLPCIYNSVATEVFKSPEDILMISDDDTDYSNLNFEEIISEIQCIKSCPRNNVGVFIPKIFSNGVLVSPGKRFLFKGRRLKKIESGFYPSKNTLAINSGTIITYDCFKKMSVLFNQNLRFYGTDTNFFVRYEKYFSYLYILNFDINHSLSENLKESIQRSYFRWQDHFYAMRITFQYFPVWIRMLLSIYILYMRFKLSLRYRSLIFWSI